MRNIKDGKWLIIETEKIFNSYLKRGMFNQEPRVKKGSFIGPGKYYKMEYFQRCPRNCCDDDVVEIISASQVAREVSAKIRELSALLKESRCKNI